MSHEHESAYENGNGFVLLRAPKDDLLRREAYEIYQGMDGNGQPVFGKDWKTYEPILRCPGKAKRVSVSYNAGLGRYLLRQEHQFSPYSNDTRYEGGFGVYEAPEPWGPYRCAYFTERGDVGSGDLGCFPTKWMSEDGTRIYHAFSGDDHFCVCGAEIVLNK